MLMNKYAIELLDCAISIASGRWVPAILCQTCHPQLPPPKLPTTRAHAGVGVAYY